MVNERPIAMCPLVLRGCEGAVKCPLVGQSMTVWSVWTGMAIQVDRRQEYGNSAAVRLIAMGAGDEPAGGGQALLRQASPPEAGKLLSTALPLSLKLRRTGRAGLPNGREAARFGDLALQNGNGWRAWECPPYSN